MGIKGFGRVRIRNLRKKFGEPPKPAFISGEEGNWLEILKSKAEGNREDLNNFIVNEVKQVGDTLAKRLFDYLKSCST
ncbi:hypothetical protein AKJ61_02475 [candidate division MSBL1 archaeon SCGC-AAA259B11]|uniref:Uncharacterized protein n=1 Tax=candidate division MSBL1 archaeon SCGC-AAA259B11 TaxID=1698260 RepID=A0A133U5Z8_9EURY|nr:hypothetical protein AKJ61_02475 [candidate division MSBL1 archaeon SCGC-AAA259B11]